jgi:starch-binding outer membrane protein, SusD/RagB family
MYYKNDGSGETTTQVNEVRKSDDQLSRNTVQEVYNLVVQDLTEAIDSEALSTAKLVGYLNEWAAKALLTRVYLTMGENQKALDVAEDIIENSPYQLWTNSEYVASWSKMSGTHSKEMIFEIAITGAIATSAVCIPMYEICKVFAEL